MKHGEPTKQTKNMFIFKQSVHFLIIIILCIRTGHTMISSQQNQTNQLQCSTSSYTPGQSSYKCQLCFNTSTQAMNSCSKIDCQYDWDIQECEDSTPQKLSLEQCQNVCCPGVQSIWDACKNKFQQSQNKIYIGRYIGLGICGFFVVIFIGIGIYIFCRKKWSKPKQELNQDLDKQNQLPKEGKDQVSTKNVFPAIYTPKITYSLSNKNTQSRRRQRSQIIDKKFTKISDRKKKFTVASAKGQQIQLAISPPTQ